jgi:hypothetical protein
MVICVNDEALVDGQETAFKRPIVIDTTRNENFGLVEYRVWNNIPAIILSPDPNQIITNGWGEEIEMIRDL